jgi:hypothetical protein
MMLSFQKVFIHKERNEITKDYKTLFAIVKPSTV